MFTQPDTIPVSNILKNIDLSFEGAVQFASSSRTAKNPGYSDKTAEILMTGPLRYEMELYSLCKKIFYERLKYFKVNNCFSPDYYSITVNMEYQQLSSDRHRRRSNLQQNEAYRIHTATCSSSRLSLRHCVLISLYI